MKMNIRNVHSVVLWFIDVQIAFGVLEMEKVIYPTSTLGNVCCEFLASIRCLHFAMHIEVVNE
jgi:hypothetical protein